VPLNERLQAAGPPRPPRLCLAADMQGLPVDSWSCDLVEVHQDYECPAMIPSGARVLISRPIPGGPFTEAQIDDMIANSPSTMEINGQSVPFQNARYPADNGLTGYDLQYNWTAPDPGVYVVTGSSLGTSYSCTLTVV
jgi:hypothetical protein